MKSVLTSFILLALGTSLLHAQTAAPATTPAATAPPVARPALPFSSSDQIIARSMSATLQYQMKLALTGRHRKDDASLVAFSTKMSARLIKQWTPFVTLCQTHKFNDVAIEVSKSQAEDIAKMVKLKGADFRKEYFKRFKMEVVRGVQMAKQSLARVQEAELRKPVESMLALFKTEAGELEEKSKEPFTPTAVTKPEPKKDPKKK